MNVKFVLTNFHIHLIWNVVLFVLFCFLFCYCFIWKVNRTIATISIGDLWSWCCWHHCYFSTRCWLLHVHMGEKRQRWAIRLYSITKTTANFETIIFESEIKRKEYRENYVITHIGWCVFSLPTLFYTRQYTQRYGCCRCIRTYCNETQKFIFAFYNCNSKLQICCHYIMLAI